MCPLSLIGVPRLGWGSIFSLVSPCFLPQQPQSKFLPFGMTWSFFSCLSQTYKPWELFTSLQLIINSSRMVLIVCMPSWLLASFFFPPVLCHSAVLLLAFLSAKMCLPLHPWGLCFHPTMHTSASHFCSCSHKGKFHISSSLRRPHKDNLEIVKVLGIWWLDLELSVCLCLTNVAGFRFWSIPVRHQHFISLCGFLIEFSFESYVCSISKHCPWFVQFQALFLDIYVVVYSVTKMISYLRWVEVGPIHETRVCFLAHWWPDTGHNCISFFLTLNSVKEWLTHLNYRRYWKKTILCITFCKARNKGK